jgi:FkbM family methyltransferase
VYFKGIRNNMTLPTDSDFPSQLLSTLRSDYEAGTLAKADYTREIWKSHQQLFEYSDFLSGTNVDAIEINAEGVLFRLRDPQLKLWCTPEDQRHVAIANFNFRQYESQELTAVLRLAKACDVFFDIGANVGFYSIAVGQRFPDSRIIAFEPIPSTYRELERNLALNHVTNVTAHNLGLSDRAHKAPFYFDPTVSGAASGAPLGPEFGATEILTCPVETLDDFVQRAGIAPDLIKCDVEGGELRVFRGARDVLERFKPIVFTEMLRKWSARFGYHPNEIIDFFRDMNYRCFVLSEGMLQPFPEMTDQTVETNFFFLHTQRHLSMVRFLGLQK